MAGIAKTGLGPEDAAARLDAAFDARGGRAPALRDGRPPVGLFGDGCPEAFVLAAGGTPVEVKAPPAGDAAMAPPERVARVVEDFLDPFAARFLARFAGGWYDGYAALVFVRDDAAGLTAYQYALELRRQGRVPAGGPDLLLWNLVRRDDAATQRFNGRMAADVAARLGAATGRAFAEDGFAAASAAEAARTEALSRAAARGVAGAEMHRWRNAGRWLAPLDHAALLDAAAARPASGPAIGLVGTALADDALHRALDGVGRVTEDLQPYGAVWPACHAGGAADLEGCLAAVARHPLHLRAMPPAAYRAALVERLAGCDVVLAQADDSDDAFGWEVPALAEALRNRGVPLVDAGLHDGPPTAAWAARAAETVSARAGVPA